MTDCCWVLDARKGVFCRTNGVHHLNMGVVSEASRTKRQDFVSEYSAQNFEPLAQEPTVHSQQVPVLEMTFTVCYPTSSLSSPPTLFFAYYSPSATGLLA